MLENLSNSLKNLHNRRIPVSIPLDENRYLDRRCHNPECGCAFKVHLDDWKNIVRDESAYCPLCRSESAGTEWNTPEQEQYLKMHGMSYIQKELGNAIERDAHSLERQSKSSFISMRLSYIPEPIQLPIPPNVADQLSQHYTCPICRCRYSILGVAYFCPSCGNENIPGNVNESLSNMESFLDKYDEIKGKLAEALTRETAEKYIIQITENHYSSIVALLQSHCEYLFRNNPKTASVKTRKNLFQNLGESSEKWKEVCGTSYEDIISRDTYLALTIHYQKRHLLAHTNGIVDQEYLDKTGATRYALGDRITIAKDDLKDFLRCAKTFVVKLNGAYGK